MLKIEDFAKRIQIFKDDLKNDLKLISQTHPKLDFTALLDKLDKELQNAEQSNKIRIIVVGQYSAGKSSLLRMLTGREDIAVGANITTEKVQKFDWHGIEIVDTPGIHTELHPDHDEISYNAIASADLLIFVVTNELFNDHIAEHFRKLAIDNGKASEMILVINKMDRTTNGNTVAQQATIREALRPVLQPYTPEQLYISFLAADSYLEGMDEKDDDPEYAAELIEQSGYQAFIDTLNRFVAEKSISSKLTTGLYILRDTIEKAAEMLQPYELDDAAKISLLHQHRHDLMEKRLQWNRDLNALFLSASEKVRNLGREVANSIQNDNRNEHDLIDFLSSNITKAKEINHSALDEARLLIDRQLNEVGLKFEDSSDEELSDSFDTLTDIISEVHSVSAGKRFVEFIRSLPQKDVKDIAVLVADGIKAIKKGGKSKAFLAANAMNYVNMALAVLQCVDTALQKVETQNLAIENRKREASRAIRSTFQQGASELMDYSKRYINQHITHPIESLIQADDSKEREFRASRNSRDENIQKLEERIVQCKDLIHEIHETDRQC